MSYTIAFEHRVINAVKERLFHFELKTNRQRNRLLRKTFSYVTEGMMVYRTSLQRHFGPRGRVLLLQSRISH